MTTSSQQLLLLRNLTKMFNKRCHTDMQIVSLSFCCMQMKIMALLIMCLIVFLFFCFFLLSPMYTSGYAGFYLICYETDAMNRSSPALRFISVT